MTTTHSSEEMAVALEAAAAGAAVLHARYAPSGCREGAGHKSRTRDLVTDADRASEAAVLRVLHERFPDDAIIAEEGAPEAPPGGRTWYVDPLDGTNNFAHGLPLFCVSVGLVVDGEPRVGVVHAPLLGEVHATDGRHATLNGRTVAVSATERVEDAILATGFAYDRENLPDDNTERFRRVLMVSRGMRRCGAAALDLAWVACGRLDGYWELWLNSWDVAAGAALVRAAGGCVTDLAGGDRFLSGRHVVATNGLLHGELTVLLDGPPRA